MAIICRQTYKKNCKFYVKNKFKLKKENKKFEQIN